MNAFTSKGSMPSDRQTLEAHADAVRTHLTRGLDALVGQARGLTAPLDVETRPVATWVLGGAAVVLGSVAAVVAYRLSTERRWARQVRASAWLRFVLRADRAVAASHGVVVAWKQS